MTTGAGPRTQHPHILVVDDHRTFAEALGIRLSTGQPVAEVALAFSEQQARECLASQVPDLILLDFRLKDGTSVDLLRDLRLEHPSLPVAMLSGLDDFEAVQQSLEAGARAWVPKEVSIEKLWQVIDLVLSGEMWIPGPLVSPVLQWLLARPVKGEEPEHTFLDELTPRQREVLSRLALGLNRSEIAEDLQLSPHTVRTHVQDILKKAGAHSTLAVLAMARAAGLPPGIPQQRR